MAKRITFALTDKQINAVLAALSEYADETAENRQWPENRAASQAQATIKAALPHPRGNKPDYRGDIGPI